MICDDYNGGQRRGKYPLGFFSWMRGFGSLDEEKLDKVMNALEKLHNRDRMVWVISHVREKGAVAEVSGGYGGRRGWEWE